MPAHKKVIIETEPTGDEEQAETPTYEASEVVVSSPPFTKNK